MGLASHIKPSPAASTTGKPQNVTLWQRAFPSAHYSGLSISDLPSARTPILQFYGVSQHKIKHKLITCNGIATKIDYELYAEYFNNIYWLRNYIKCLAAARVLAEHIPQATTFFDIGGGIGPFSSAILDTMPRANVSIIDRSRTQLRVFETLQTKGILSNNFKFILQSLSLTNLCDISAPKLFSYMLCENPDFLRDNRKTLKIIGSLSIIVDYASVVEKIGRRAKNAGMGATWFTQIEIPLDQSLSDLIGQQSISVSGGVFWK